MRKYNAPTIAVLCVVRAPHLLFPLGRWNSRWSARSFVTGSVRETTPLTFCHFAISETYDPAQIHKRVQVRPCPRSSGAQLTAVIKSKCRLARRPFGLTCSSRCLIMNTEVVKMPAKPSRFDHLYKILQIEISSGFCKQVQPCSETRDMYRMYAFLTVALASSPRQINDTPSCTQD